MTSVSPAMETDAKSKMTPTFRASATGWTKRRTLQARAFLARGASHVPAGYSGPPSCFSVDLSVPICVFGGSGERSFREHRGKVRL